jgi:prepilin-type N-terminal cleavage/methylation domain-containing protein/prepilin-type processing-associated H-X9-DG protein
MQRKRAFTLIELLVVIAIIAILAAILFPVFAKAREKAKQSQSLNNVKQLTLGVMQYSQDYDETFPGWVQNSNGSFAHNTWDEQINSQIKSNDVFSNGNTGIKSPSDPKKDRVLTYAINGALIAPVNAAGSVTWGGVTAANGPALLGPSSVTSPAETILFAEVATDAPPITTPTGAISRRTDAISGPGVVADSQGSSEWLSAQPSAAGSAVIDISPFEWVAQGLRTNVPYDDNQWTAAAYGSPINAKGVARDLYSGGGTYGFVDGHVKFLKISETVGLNKNLGGTAITPANCWFATNTYNMWYPSR